GSSKPSTDTATSISRKPIRKEDASTLSTDTSDPFGGNSSLTTQAGKYKTAQDFADAIATADNGATYSSAASLVTNVPASKFGDAILVEQDTTPATVAKWVKRIQAGERPPVLVGSRGAGMKVTDGH